MSEYLHQLPTRHLPHNLNYCYYMATTIDKKTKERSADYKLGDWLYNAADYVVIWTMDY